MVAAAPSLQEQGLQVDDFALFGLARSFALAADDLEARWKALQAQAHPDRFVAHGSAAQRLAMQWSVRINEAYQRLKSPLSRAAYLCELAGFAVGAHDNTAMPLAFLQQQMAWREALEQADGDAAALEALLAQTRAAQTQCLSELATAFDGPGDAAQAATQVRSLMFIDKFERTLLQRLDALE